MICYRIVDQVLVSCHQKDCIVLVPYCAADRCAVCRVCVLAHALFRLEGAHTTRSPYSSSYSCGQGSWASLPRHPSFQRGKAFPVFLEAAMDADFPLSLPNGTEAVSLRWEDDCCGWVLEAKTNRAAAATWTFGKVRNSVIRPLQTIQSLIWSAADVGFCVHGLCVPVWP